MVLQSFATFIRFKFIISSPSCQYPFSKKYFKTMACPIGIFRFILYNYVTHFRKKFKEKQPKNAIQHGIFAKKNSLEPFKFKRVSFGGEDRIRTCGRLPYTTFPMSHHRPLRHLSVRSILNCLTIILKPFDIVNFLRLTFQTFIFLRRCDRPFSNFTVLLAEPAT